MVNRTRIHVNYREGGVKDVQRLDGCTYMHFYDRDSDCADNQFLAIKTLIILLFDTGNEV